MTTCFNPINHRENRKKQEYLDIELPPHPFEEAITTSVHHIWNEHPNASFFHTWHTILVSLWLCMGHRILTFTFHIFKIRKEKLKRIFPACSDIPLPLKLWTYYRKRKKHGKKKKGRTLWGRVAFTSTYNVDDKVNKSNGNSIFDTDTSFVVCDNSANTHICNNKDMFVTFKATTGGKLNQPAGIGTLKWTRKDDSGAVHTELLENTLYFPSPRST